MNHYQEQYRPQYHFSPEANWMNDPNGMAYLDGEYHLFYQYHPDSPVWGPMHWGHAVSPDLIHWQHLPIALFPDSLGYIFSGSTVVDTKNSSGLGTDQNPAMTAIFTYHNPELEKKGSNSFQSQGIAYSIDKGRTWTKYSGNPVLKSPEIRDFRDPKVFWHSETGKWIMILTVKDRVHLYSSPNLLDWSFESEFGKEAGAHSGIWECPDLFQLEVEGSDTSKWVMIVSLNPGGPNGGSATQYFTGEFDGHIFTPDYSNVGAQWVDWGRDNYAGVTWSNIPDKDGRRIIIGWMSNWDYATKVPTNDWRSAMTIPRELSLIKVKNKHSLISNPIREFEKMRSNSVFIGPTKIAGENEINLDKIPLMQSELIFEFNLADDMVDSLGIIMMNNMNEKLVIGYSGYKKQFIIDRRTAGDSAFSKKFTGISAAPYNAGSVLKLHIFIDAASVELFVDDGKLVMTSLIFPTEKFNRLIIVSEDGKVYLDKAKLYGLEGIWRSSSDQHR